MNIKYIVATLFLWASFAAGANAQAAKLGSNYVQLSQTTRAMNADKSITYIVNAIWKHTATPESIFFRADDLWQNCIVEKDNVEISPDKIKKGYRITFKTMNGGKFAIPEQLKKMPAPALFFQVAKTWYYMPVRNIVPGKGKAK